METLNAVITGVGGYVPDYILDNEEMSRIVDTSDEWIMERIGVKTRHILKPEQGSGTSYMMTRARRPLTPIQWRWCSAPPPLPTIISPPPLRL